MNVYVVFTDDRRPEENFRALHEDWFHTSGAPMMSINGEHEHILYFLRDYKDCKGAEGKKAYLEYLQNAHDKIIKGVINLPNPMYWRILHRESAGINDQQKIFCDFRRELIYYHGKNSKVFSAINDKEFGTLNDLWEDQQSADMIIELLYKVIPPLTIKEIDDLESWVKDRIKNITDTLIAKGFNQADIKAVDTALENLSAAVTNEEQQEAFKETATLSWNLLEKLKAGSRC